jgi:hypothetical protein
VKHADQLEMLVDGLRLLAASAAEQVAALPPYVCIPDELILTFSDAYLLVPQLVREGIVSLDAAAALGELDDHLEAMPADLSESSGLESHPFWSEARVLAGAALQSLGRADGPVVLRHSTYVK